MPTLEVTAYSGLGPGSHDVVVTAIETKTAKAGGLYLRWEFTAADGKSTSANSAVEITPGNKTGKWIGSLRGRAVEVGERVATESVIGLPAAIFIEENADGYTKVISVQGRTVSPKRATPAALAVAQSEPSPEIASPASGDAAADDLPF